MLRDIRRDQVAQRAIHVIHSGWGGDTVRGGSGGAIDVRLPRDVLAHRPTVLTIMLGMNDAAYRPFDPAILNAYEKGYEHILDVVQGALPHLRITLIQPSPFDDTTRPVTFEGGYNVVLLRYADYVKSMAKSLGIDTADFNAPVVAALKRAVQINSAEATKLIPDRVHPSPAIHLIMAESLLKAWRAPAAVSDVEINASSHRVTQAAGATVTNWKGMEWDCIEKVLPMPLDWDDPLVALAMQSSDFVEALDQETLRVDGLPPGKWQLTIDEKPVGAFTNEEWKKGVNLARLKTPMMAQAMEVLDLTKLHALTQTFRLRDFQMPLATRDFTGTDATLRSIDQLEAENGAEATPESSNRLASL